jgi:hypothetical protein
MFPNTKSCIERHMNMILDLMKSIWTACEKVFSGFVCLHITRKFLVGYMAFGSKENCSVALCE